MYDTQLVTIKVKHLDIKLHTVTNVDALFDNLLQKGKESEEFKDERIPYWAELWPSALALAEYMVEQNDTIEKKTIFN